MSDSALSQAEIDALLSGAGAGSPPGGAGGGDEGDRAVIEGFLAGTTGGSAGALSQMTGAQVSVTGPRTSWTDRDGFLPGLPDTVTSVKADFSSGFPGEHLFLMGEDTAKAIAALMNKEDNIELDEMAMSVIGEVVGTIVGSQITALTGKTGNKSIANVPPEAVNVPRAAAALPAGNFLEAAYDVDLGDGASHTIWELYGPSVASSMARSLSGGPQAANPGSRQASGMGGMGSLGGMGGGGGAFSGTPANVQSVEFPSLLPQASPQEQANITLLMDVYMEMTVELGRTRKLIKE
ncbi:MAG: flagellar motor switch protein FliN, partial [Spirochaetaceae bacterium]|nr:flagellar motor switch protein FliN [Spirochaetaceae bacterium]